MMDFSLFVGTHHKTGTMWMLSIFQAFAARAGLPFFYFSEHCRDLSIDTEDSDPLLLGYGLGYDGIIFLDHSEGLRTMASLLPKARWRMFHVVRDPRDIAISSAEFHLRSDDPWLHMPRAEFGGMTYHERITTYQSLDDRVLFEIENSSAWTVNEIRQLMDVPDIEVFKYEDFATIPETFRKLFDYCGFHKDYQQLFERAVDEHTVLGEPRARTMRHVSDGRVEQWREKLSPATLEAVDHAFGDVIRRLGYPASF